MGKSMFLMVNPSLPYRKSMVLMGKSTLNMTIFNSKLFNYQRVIMGSYQSLMMARWPPEYPRVMFNIDKSTNSMSYFLLQTVSLPEAV